MGGHMIGSRPNYLKGSAPDWDLREGGTDTVEAGHSQAYTGLDEPHTLPGHLLARAAIQLRHEAS
jgi:hypothetical protein